MKKFISLALTAAMVASLVPATAFAKTKEGDDYRGTVSVVNAWNENKDFKGHVVDGTDKVPEVQVKVTDVSYQGTADAEKVARFTVRLDNANFFTKDQLSAANAEATRAAFNRGIELILDPTYEGSAGNPGTAVYTYTELTPTQKRTILGNLYEDLLGGTAATFPNMFAISNSTLDTDTSGAVDADELTKITQIASGSKDAVTKAILTGTNGANTSWSANVTTGNPVTTGDNFSLDQIRLAALTISAANSGAMDGLTVADYVYSSDYGAAHRVGWYDKNHIADETKFVEEATIIAEATTNTGNKYSDGTTLSGTLVKVIAADCIKDGKFVAVTSTPVNKETWITAAVAKLDAAMTTTKIYTEAQDGATGYVPGSGFKRTGMTAEIARVADMRTNEITVTVKSGNNGARLQKGDIISIDLTSELVNASKNASVSVASSDFILTNDNADLTYVNVDKEALQLSIRKVVDVAEDEVVTLDNKGLSIKTNVGFFRTGDNDRITLKISGGFEFVPASVEDGKDWEIVAKKDGAPETGVSVYSKDKEEIVLEIEDGKSINEITVYGIDVKAASAKIDKVCTIKATAPGFTSSSAVEVAKVVDYIVNLTVDEDEDVPVIYSGVNVDNDGITDDSDHWSLDVTAKESFPGAWSFRKGFNFELPDHVFVTDVEVVSTENLLLSEENATVGATPVGEDHVFVAFFNAYQNGSHVNFEFDKRVFDDVDAKLTEDPAEMTFRLQLVADTGFEGDVPLKLTGELVEEQEVTIAKFVKPFEVKAEQNDIIIDYRYTDIPTAITITEAEAGLWDGGKATFRFDLEKSDSTFLAFEDATFEIDSKSGLSIKDDDVKDNQIVFTVDDESDDAAATVTMKNIQLFMNRSIPAGPYDLTLGSSLQDAYLRQMLFAPDEIDDGIADEADYRTKAKPVADAWKSGNTRPSTATADEDSYVTDVDDVMDTVKEGFVNVVTAGRDVDDASFTTKVVVPVGENYIVAGEKQIELDTPAYINAAGYTMLPIRAVATALGINNNNVLWDQPTKTVTILYGQRIITMTQGQKVVYVNGSAIPASAAVENTNSRTFLPMRDLATALGVTDIQWDQATRTATLNGNQKGNQ